MAKLISAPTTVADLNLDLNEITELANRGQSEKNMVAALRIQELDVKIVNTRAIFEGLAIKSILRLIVEIRKKANLGESHAQLYFDRSDFTKPESEPDDVCKPEC